jgi:hypothetical protein
MTKIQRTNNDISNTTQKIKDLGTRNPQKLIYKTPSWKLKVEQHKHNKTPIIYKTLHRKLKI